MSPPFLPNDIAGRTVIAALVLLVPAIAVARARAGRPAGPSGRALRPRQIRQRQTGRQASRRPQTAGTGNVAAVDPANPAPQKSLTAKAIEKVKEVAKSAGDIFSRVPCLPPKGGVNPVGSLPHVAGKLASGQPVVIIAFGSSSTTSYGATSPEFTYPNRLAAQLRRQYPTADITMSSFAARAAKMRRK